MKLKPIAIFDLLIPDPSGVAFFNNHLFIVSDRNGTIYKTSLTGEIKGEIKTKFKDLEGITIDNNANIWIVSEAKRTLIQLDLLGNVLSKAKIKGEQNFKNSGLEGVCIHPKTGHFYVLNEKKPRELIQLSENKEIIKTRQLNFSGDVSGICFDEIENCFWVVSDESRAFFKINSDGKVLEKHKIPVKKPEGIVAFNQQLYVVSDKENKLYIFKKP
ncbi:MAG: SdiA-regulated domain-containing protein [Lutibacter sp.]